MDYLPGIMAASVGFDPSDTKVIYSFYTLSMYLSFFTYVVSLNMYLILNCILYIDMYLILRNPFSPMKDRVVRYKIMTSILSLGVSVYTIWILTGNNSFLEMARYLKT